MTTRPLWLVALALIASTSLVACRQALGLEHADVAQETDPMTKRSSPMGRSGYLDQACVAEPQDPCLTCRTTCDIDACLTEHDDDDDDDEPCRSQAENYAVCLDTTCESDSDVLEACASDITNPGLHTCVSHCQKDCRATPLFSICELYCSCMDQWCSGQRADCMNACESQNPEITKCQLAHCEFVPDAIALAEDQDAAKREQAHHCSHATGSDPICGAVLMPSKSEGLCLNKSEIGWPCAHDSECCSMKCSGGTCLPK